MKLNEKSIVIDYNRLLSGEGNVVLFALHDVELLLSDLPLLPAIMFVDIAGEFDNPVTFVGDIQHCDGEFVQENVGGVDIAKPLVVLQQTLFQFTIT